MKIIQYTYTNAIMLIRSVLWEERTFNLCAEKCIINASLTECLSK